VLWCVAVRCSVLQRISVYCSLLQCAAECRDWQCVAGCYSVVQCDAVHCSVLQRGTACCSVLQ